MVFKNTGCVLSERELGVGNAELATESVDCSALSLESVDNVKSSDSLSASVLGVCDSVTNNVLKECLDDTSGFLVHETRDTLNTTSSSKTTDSWLSDALDVVFQDLAESLGASFAETFTSFASARHVRFICC